MTIVVPSLGRAGTATSMKWLPLADRKIIFAVHTEEAVAYKAAYPEVDIMVLSNSCKKHTGLVRREIMDRMGEPFFFVDDDIRVSLKAVNSIAEMFNVLEDHMRFGVSMAGLGQQLFSNMAEAKSVLFNGDAYVIRNRFVATVYGINPSHFGSCPLELLPVYEDMALVYHAIQSGKGTVTSYIATHSNVSPAKGGCNSWRNKEITVQSLSKLVELYPDICSIRPTSSTTHSQQIGIGLRTAWSKIKRPS